MAKKSAPAQAATQDEELPQTAVRPRGKDAVIQTLQEQLATYMEQPAGAEEEPKEPAQSSEEETFKKRYGDLRRHLQQKETSYSKKIDELSAQVEQLTKLTNQPMPQNKEEFEAWKAKYPQIAGFIEIIADEKANQRAAQLKEELDGVKVKLVETEKEKAFATLKVLVPDLEDVVKSKEYKDWFTAQPEFVQEELNTSEDPHRIAYWMNIFRTTSGKPVTQSKKEDRLAVLETGGKSIGATPTANSGKFKYTASQISKMSPAEYEKNEATIIEARNSGQVLDDMSKRNTVWDM